MFATSSVKGTIIRVLSLSNFKRLFSFKRGINEYKIYNLSFDVKDKYFIVSSESGSIHLFKIGKSSIKNNESTIIGSFYNKMNWVGSSIMNMVPLKLQDEDNISRSIVSQNSEDLKLNHIICIYGDYGYIENDKNDNKSLESSDKYIGDLNHFNLKFITLNIKGQYYKCSYDEKNNKINLGNLSDISKIKLLG